GYPNQKPAGILSRVVQASSRPGSWVLDFFAGSGTTADVSRQLGRRFVMVDDNPEAIKVMQRRLGDFRTLYVDEDGSTIAAVAEDQQSLFSNNGGSNDL